MNTSKPLVAQDTKWMQDVKNIALTNVLPFTGQIGGPIIDNVAHLQQIIMIYGKNVFKSKPIHDEMLLFIIKCFITKPFLYNDIIIGAEQLSNLEQFVPANTNLSRLKITRMTQRREFTDFWQLFITHFTDTTIQDPTQHIIKNTHMSGTYNAILPYYADDNLQVIDTSKLIRYAIVNNDDVSSGQIDLTDHSYVNYQWMIEFCTFIITMSILMYIDCNLITNLSKQKE